MPGRAAPRRRRRRSFYYHAGLESSVGACKLIRSTFTFWVDHISKRPLCSKMHRWTDLPSEEASAGFHSGRGSHRRITRHRRGGQLILFNLILPLRLCSSSDIRRSERLRLPRNSLLPSVDRDDKTGKIARGVLNVFFFSVSLSTLFVLERI